ncbi:MAG: helix-turn-helix domain-containing protein [Nitrososphaerales archaeon]
MNAEQLFGKRVRAARKAARFTLQQAAEKLDIHLNHLSQIERGKSRPSFEQIIHIADVFGVPPMSLFMFDREETGEKGLRRKINSLLDKYNADQLGHVYRYMKFMIGP